MKLCMRGLKAYVATTYTRTRHILYSCSMIEIRATRTDLRGDLTCDLDFTDKNIFGEPRTPLIINKRSTKRTFIN